MVSAYHQAPMSTSVVKHKVQFCLQQGLVSGIACIAAILHARSEKEIKQVFRAPWGAMHVVTLYHNSQESSFTNFRPCRAKIKNHLASTSAAKP